MMSIIPVHFKNPCKLALTFPCVILLITKGNGSINIAGKQVEVQPQRIVFFCNQCQANLDGELEGYQLGFEQTLLDVFLFKLQDPAYHWLKHLSDPCIDQPPVAFALTLSLVEQIQLLCGQQADFQVLQKYLVMLLTHFNLNTAGKSSLNPETVVLQQMMELIGEHFKEHRDTGFYTHKMRTNSKVLNELCWKYRNKRFFDVLMDHLLLEADVLLLDPRLMVKTIAYELGFTHHTQFTTYYSRKKGYSPSTFRGAQTN